MVTPAGIAVNPRREELRERLTQAGMQVLEITQLHALAEQITGTPAPLPPAGRVIAKVIGWTAPCWIRSENERGRNDDA